jgi:hypothetical protein
MPPASQQQSGAFRLDFLAVPAPTATHSSSADADAPAAAAGAAALPVPAAAEDAAGAVQQADGSAQPVSGGQVRTLVEQLLAEQGDHTAPPQPPQPLSTHQQLQLQQGSAEKRAVAAADDDDDGEPDGGEFIPLGLLKKGRSEAHVQRWRKKVKVAGAGAGRGGADGGGGGGGGGSRGVQHAVAGEAPVKVCCVGVWFGGQV